MGRYIQEEEEFRVFLFKTNKEPEQKKQPFQQPYQQQKWKQGTKPPDQRSFGSPTQFGETSGQRGAFAGQASQKPVPSFPCIFCEKKGHYHQDCEKFQDLTDRRNIVSKKMLCYLCLRPGHGIKDNKCNQKFRSKGCFHCGGIGFHNVALCPIKFQDKVRPAPPLNQPARPGRGNQGSPQQQHSHSGIKVVECLSKSSFSKKNSYLMTANVFIKNPSLPQGGRWVKAFIDSGCGQTYILKTLSQELGLPVERTEYLQFNVFLNKKSGCDSDVINFQVFLKDGSVLDIEANTVPSTTGPITRESLVQADLHALQEVGLGQLADDIPNHSHAFIPEIVFGIDYWNQLFPGGNQILLPSGLKLHHSKFGYLLVGHTKSHQTSNNQVQCANFVRSNSCQSIPKFNEFSIQVSDQFCPCDMKEYWDLQSVGIKDCPITKDDDLALARFNSTIRFENGRYQVQWPWKEENPDLPSNYTLALGRLRSLVKRLHREKGATDLLTKLSEYFQEYRDKGIVEVVEDVDSSIPKHTRIHYLPHHPVITPLRTTTKIRPVFDASSKARKDLNSLNDCLYRGPVLLPDLTGLLLRARMSPIIVLADIEKAFLQVGLQPQERDVTRFLWLKDTAKPVTVENLLIYRFARVPFGVIASPFQLAVTCRHHLKKEGSPIAQIISENLYVDNMQVGVQTLEDAKNLYRQGKDIFSKGSMNLREWISNSEEFNQFLPDIDRQNAPNHHVKNLGIIWDLKNDTFSLSRPKSVDVQ
ncbi:MAG: hypothetical protein GY696_14370 [Gammaproteobacteria bacterium]|nr:hypothetical protein [Gammaproteobacteria bacterium]